MLGRRGSQSDPPHPSGLQAERTRKFSYAQVLFARGFIPSEADVPRVQC